MQCMWNHGQPVRGWDLPSSTRMNVQDSGKRASVSLKMAVILSRPVSKSGPILDYMLYSGVAHCKIGAAGGVGRFSNSTPS